MRFLSWRAILAAGGVLSLLVAVADADMQPLLAQLFFVVGLVVAWRRIRQMPPTSRRAWRFFLVGGSLMFIGGNVRAAHAVIAGVDDPFPSAAEPLFLAGYVAFVLGAFELLRRRTFGAKDLGAWTDALIVTTAIGIVTWVTLLDAHATDASVPLGTRLMNIAYSIASFAVLAVAIRLIQAPGNRPLPYYLFGGAVGLFVASDFVSTYEFTHELALPLTLILTLPIYTLFVATIYHPEVHRLTGKSSRRRTGPEQRKVVLVGFGTRNTADDAPARVRRHHRDLRLLAPRGHLRNDHPRACSAGRPH